VIRYCACQWAISSSSNRVVTLISTSPSGWSGGWAPTPPAALADRGHRGTTTYVRMPPADGGTSRPHEVTGPSSPCSGDRRCRLRLPRLRCGRDARASPCGGATR
jgi:hypothetical protein